MSFPIPRSLYASLQPDTRHCVILVDRMYFNNLDCNQPYPHCITLPANRPKRHIFGDEVTLWAERIQPDVDAFVHSTPEFLEWLLRLALDSGLGVPGRYEGGTYVFLRSELTPENKLDIKVLNLKLIDV